MIRHYCTLFDKNFLAKGLALYNSLLEHSEVSWKLHILCLDNKTYELLQKLNLKNALLIPLAEIEDAALLEAKTNRNATEYCWTLTPSLPLHILNANPEIDLTTYLDADLFFYSSPEQIFKEFSDNSILLIPHNLPPEKKEKEKTVGKYNVGMMIFRRDEAGMSCLKWWRTECNNWCYEVPVEGKLGDQKYLDYFEERFAGVYVLHHPGANLAGWNIKNYRGKIIKNRHGVYINNRPLIFFHFSSFKLYHPHSRLLPNGPINAHKYFLPSIEKNIIYKEYTEAVLHAYKTIQGIESNFICGLTSRPNLITQLKDTAIPLTREFLARRLYKFKNGILHVKARKKLIILEHNNGRLANQLWNFVSIYAYSLEKGYNINNYCFNIYSDFFNIPLDNKIIKFLFYNKYNKGFHFYRRFNLYGAYVAVVKCLSPKQFVYSGEHEAFYLPPTPNQKIDQAKQINVLELSSKKRFYFSGWLFRNTHGIKKYHHEIVNYFRPTEQIENKINSLIAPLQNSYELLIGVHIRQVDYKTYAGGKYYYSSKDIRKIINNFVEENKLDINKVLFIVCSDERVDKEIFSGLNYINPQGSAAEDLFTLARTNMIIGSDSTYGAWAAYYGNIPIVFFSRNKINWPKINQTGFNFPDGLYRK